VIISKIKCCWIEGVFNHEVNISVLEEFNINQAGSETEGKLQTSGKTKQSRFPTIGDFIGPEYKGMYMKSAFKSVGDPWDSINMFLSIWMAFSPQLLDNHQLHPTLVEFVPCRYNIYPANYSNLRNVYEKGI
jgi:hypothetical protein